MKREPIDDTKASFGARNGVSVAEHGNIESNIAIDGDHRSGAQQGNQVVPGLIERLQQAIDAAARGFSLVAVVTAEMTK